MSSGFAFRVKDGLARTVNSALAPIHFRVAARRLLALEVQYRARGEDVFHVPFRYQGPGIYSVISPSQVLEEIRSLYEAVRGIQPRTVCEIGTDKGGTFYLWCQAAADDATVVSVDLPSRLRYSPARRRLYARFRKTDRQKLHFIPGDSHSSGTLTRVKEAVCGRPIDFLFIDGDHSYAGARQDYEMYSPLVRPNGLIALHDIHTERDGVGVPRLWEELKRSAVNYQEFSAPGAGGPTGCGIGIILKD